MVKRVLREIESRIAFKEFRNDLLLKSSEMIWRQKSKTGSKNKKIYMQWKARRIPNAIFLKPFSLYGNVAYEKFKSKCVYSSIISNCRYVLAKLGHFTAEF